MSLFVYLGGSLVGVSSIRLNADGFPGPQMTAAADGSGSQGSIVFDDPTGSLTVTGWQTIVVDEPDCTSAPRLFTGLVYDRTYRRGPYRLGAGREIDTTLNDSNAYLNLQIITAGDAVRPAETDTQRLAWLINSPYLSGMVYDLGLVNGAGRNFDAANYHGQTPMDVLNDLCGPRGQIFFTYWDQTAKKIGLFFDDPTSTAHTSTLTISNVESDVTRDANGIVSGTCYPPLGDGELTADPSEVYSNIRYVYAHGVVYLYRTTTTAATFFPAPIGTRGINVENDRVGKLSTATTFANRILDRDSDEAFTVTCTVRLPSTKVGLIDAGMRIFVRFSHLPGFETGAYTRIERKSIVQTEGDPTQYDVTLTMSTHGLTNAGSGSGDPGDLPHPPSQPGSLVQYKTDTGTVNLDHTPIDGDLLLLWTTERSTFTYPTTPSGWTSVATAKNLSAFGDNYYARLSYKIASSESTAVLLGSTSYIGTVMEWSGVSLGSEVHQSDQNVPNTAGVPLTCGGAITPSAANAIVVGCGIVGTFGGSSVTPDSGVTELSDTPFGGGNAPDNWVGYEVVASPASTTIGGTIVGRSEFGGVTVTLLPVTTAEAPSVGQWVYDETPTPAPGGGNTVFYTAFPYAQGSLRVWVDLVEQTAAVTESDPETGQFTLAFDPRSFETLLVSYQGAA